PPSPPSQINLSDLNLTTNDYKYEVWKSDIYHSGYLSGQMQLLQNGGKPEMNVTFEYFNGETSLGTVPQSYSNFLDAVSPQNITKWTGKPFNRVTATVSNLNISHQGKINLTNLSVNDLTNTPSKFTNPEDLEK
ncbi:hypothetical protein, partial [Bacillus wiedmannii]|uniref:hypothetical protein n=1 Tax=Bacillus wiedmannii TaxID=1890302 RepID=UPI000BEC5C1F